MKFYNVVATYFNKQGKLETVTMSLPLSDTSKETLQGLRVGFAHSLLQKGYHLNSCTLNGVAF
ncbi:hypothetical protein CN327_17665 [Bacillus cereus]|nr:hypothetical protein CN327_17665 [Bacillus cereus]